MSDPRYTDEPRYTDPRLREPQVRDVEARRSGGMWGWIAGVAVLALIAFVMISSWSNTQNTASNNAPPAATRNAPAGAPPTTTGAGGNSPAPLSPPANSQPANR